MKSCAALAVIAVGVLLMGRPPTPAAGVQDAVNASSASAAASADCPAPGVPGTRLWSFASAAPTPNSTFDWISGAPAISADRTVHFGTVGNGVQAVDCHGDKRWQATTGAAFEGSAAIGDSGTLYIGDDIVRPNYLFAIRPDGSAKWTYETMAANSFMDVSPALDNSERVFAGSNSSQSRGQGGSILAFDAEGDMLDGFPLDTGPVFGSPVVLADNRVVFVASAGHDTPREPTPAATARPDGPLCGIHSEPSRSCLGGLTYTGQNGGFETLRDTVDPYPLSADQWSGYGAGISTHPQPVHGGEHALRLFGPSGDTVHPIDLSHPDAPDALPLAMWVNWSGPDDGRSSIWAKLGTLERVLVTDLRGLPRNEWTKVVTVLPRAGQNGRNSVLKLSWTLAGGQDATIDDVELDACCLHVPSTPEPVATVLATATVTPTTVTPTTATAAPTATTTATASATTHPVVRPRHRALLPLVFVRQPRQAGRAIEASGRDAAPRPADAQQTVGYPARMHVITDGHGPGAVFDLGDFGVSSLAAMDDVVVAGLGNNVVAMRVGVRPEVLWTHPIGGFLGSPLIGQRDPVTGWWEIYVRSNTTVTALSAPLDGVGVPRQRWAVEQRIGCPFSYPQYGCGTPVLGDAGLIYVPLSKGVVALRRTDGSEAWTSLLAFEGEVSTAATLAPGGVLYIGTSEGELIAVSTESDGPDPSAAWPSLRHDPRNTGRAAR